VGKAIIENSKQLIFCGRFISMQWL